ncbi:1,4-dihydroxy-2-naphthoyl-CoA hydrolase [Defluviimonas aquaemixtae]|uniref:1,4-dihydroxy-2-naphthoyl-CoA hydrolase n=1 Tax=Albidovulum aquaemixtae TaxID=1542388 RepID=A0A2R8B789_9RHOB|nr:thioesterase family protein [Defluviimonas aquaemixtae]SPH18402.1 1,4-dihydroxy-2-naphthoyl-CoA hydrolase [Defluviimonas aquaemixtae]
MSFSRDFTVQFGHCDPAGIIFFPRYFEMLNATVEAFFAEALNYSFTRIHIDEGCGVPTAHLDVDFRAPSRLADILTFTLNVVRIGGSSASFETRVTCGEELRMTVRQVIVWTGPGLRPARWPAGLAVALGAHLTGEEAAT